jgi:hypothetical protein
MAIVPTSKRMMGIAMSKAVLVDMVSPWVGVIVGYPQRSLGNIVECDCMIVAEKTMSPPRKSITACPLKEGVGEGCVYDREHHARGMCRFCYNAARRQKNRDSLLQTHRRYNKSVKGKNRMRAYSSSETGRERKRQWARDYRQVMSCVHELIGSGKEPAVVFLREENVAIDSLSPAKADFVVELKKVPKKVGRPPVVQTRHGPARVKVIARVDQMTESVFDGVRTGYTKVLLVGDCQMMPANSSSSPM